MAETQYRYLCDTEQVFVTETRALGDAAPTVCVNEGGSFDAASLTIIFDTEEDFIDPINPIIVMSFNDQSRSHLRIKNKSYTTVGSFAFKGSPEYPKSIKFIAKMDDNNSGKNYSIRIVEGYNVICEKTGQNNEEYEIVDFGNLTFYGTTEAMWEIQVKVSNGTGYLQTVQFNL